MDLDGFRSPDVDEQSNQSISKHQICAELRPSRPKKREVIGLCRLVGAISRVQLPGFVGISHSSVGLRTTSL